MGTFRSGYGAVGTFRSGYATCTRRDELLSEKPNFESVRSKKNTKTFGGFNYCRKFPPDQEAVPVGTFRSDYGASGHF